MHNIKTIEVPETETLQYHSSEEKVVAKAFWHAQMYIMQKGVKKFGKKGTNATKAEVKQMHEQIGFRALAVKELTF